MSWKSPGAAREPGITRTLAALALVALVAAAAPLPVGLAQAADSNADIGQDPHFVPMDEIIVPIIESDRLGGAFRFKLALVARDAEAIAQLRRQMPILRAAGVTAGLEFARLDVSAFRPVNVVKFSGQLSTTLSALEPALTRVLIIELAAEPG